MAGTKKRTKRGYFYEREEKAVTDYLASQDAEEKNKIFIEILEPAFTKMVESIIRRYKLFIPDEEFEETFNDTMSFLLSKLDTFNPDRGYKAYSYCGTICKNYLIAKEKFNPEKNMTVPQKLRVLLMKPLSTSVIKWSFIPLGIIALVLYLIGTSSREMGESFANTFGFIS